MVASVIGREFGLDQLKRLIDDLSDDRLLEVLEEALSARVIEELPRAPSRYQFTHALIQETLAEELSLTRRGASMRASRRRWRPLSRHELEPAVISLRCAFEHYAQAGDVSRAVTVAAHPIPFSLGLGYTDFAELIAHALKLVSPDSHEAGQLLAQHGLYSGLV